MPVLHVNATTPAQYDALTDLALQLSLVRTAARQVETDLAHLIGNLDVGTVPAERDHPVVNPAELLDRAETAVRTAIATARREGVPDGVIAMMVRESAHRRIDVALVAGE